MILFDTPIGSPIVILLTVLFGITSSITTFDKRLIQAKKTGVLPVDKPMLPTWVGFIAWLHWGLGLAILLLNWKYAIAVFVVKFVLEVLPVLETIGNVLMRPFRPKAK